MQILDFIIAMIFLCLILSLFVSWSVEFYSDKINKKGKLLEKMLSQFMGGEDSVEWTKKLYQHPLIKSLAANDKRLTSYIPPSIFTKAISDIIINSSEANAKGSNTSSDYISLLKEGASQIPDCNFKKTINLFISQSENDKSKLDSMIEDWYDQYMIRVNHTYKRSLKAPLWLSGIVIALFFNIDAIRITSYVWNDTQLQKNIANEASIYVQQNSSLDSTINLDALKKYQSSFGIPLGWDNEKTYYNEQIVTEQKSKPQYFIYKILGILLTSIIASFGAPFWYDALRKIIGIKSSLKTQKQT